VAVDAAVLALLCVLPSSPHSSSGIGLATVQALAAQGLNVVLVAMPDDLLASATKSLSEKYTAQVRRGGWERAATTRC
jgi:NAD(P)-dependent dehydrogenase (short-subunit alcohol dehydrogenase family)